MGLVLFEHATKLQPVLDLTFIAPMTNVKWKFKWKLSANLQSLESS